MSAHRAGFLAQVRRVLRVLGFTGYFIVLLTKSNLQVTWDLVTPGSSLAPGIVGYALRCRTPVEVTIFSNLVTLTPGTLVVAVTDGPPTAYIHGMYAPDADGFRREMRDLEDRLLRAWRTEEDA